MRRVSFPILLAFLCLSCGNGDDMLEVTYIGNEGFMIATGGTKVLIDALHRSPYYVGPSDSMTARLIDGVPPFDHVDFFLVTHDHADHFDAGMISRFLRRHPETRLIANPATWTKLSGDSIAGGQHVSLDLARGERRTIEGDEAEVTALRLDHGGSLDISNLAYLVRVHGHSFFHVGDARLKENEQYLRTVDWAADAVDLVFVEFFDRDSDTQSILQNVIKPKHVIFMHIPAGEEEKVRKDNAWIHPRTVVFGREGETRRFDGSAGGE